MGLALGPSLRAVLRFTLGGQDKVRRGEPGHALVSHVSPLPQQPAASSRCHQPLEIVWRLDLARGLSLVPRDLAGLFAGSNFCLSSFYLPSTRAGLAGWGARAPQPSLPQC